MKRLVLLLCWFVAQGVLAATVTETITLDVSNGSTVGSATTGSVALSDDALEIVIRCESGVNCANVTAALKTPQGTSIPQSLQGAGSERKVTIPKTQVSSGVFEFQASLNNIEITGTRINISAAAAAAAPPAGTSMTASNPPATTTSRSAENARLFELLTFPCRATVGPGQYDIDGNVGTIVVTPLGQVLSSNIDAFDENDDLIVKVIAHPEIVTRLVIERSSAFRDRTDIRILGEGPTRDQFALQTTAAVTCQVVERKLSNFAPGRGSVQISVRASIEEIVPVASFDFYVDPLYVGLFSAGPIWTDNVDPGFAVVSDGSESLIAATNTGSNDLEYGVFFTPFLWGKRDIEKNRKWYRRQGRKYPYWQHINPSIGLLFDDIDENALVGITVDFPRGFVLTGGWHFREIQKLDPGAGLAPGDPFSGMTSDLPIVNEWEDDTFVAVTLDLRILVRLLSAAVTGGTRDGGS